MKKLLLPIIAALPFIGGVAYADQFISGVSNPFSLCEAPKPCNKCQPMRSYYEQLCESNKAEGDRAIAKNTADLAALTKNNQVSLEQTPQINYGVQSQEPSSQTQNRGGQQQGQGQQVEQSNNAAGFGIVTGSSNRSVNTLDLLK